MAEDKTDPAMNRIPRPVSPADIYPNPGTKNEATPSKSRVIAVTWLMYVIMGTKFKFIDTVLC